MASSGVILNVPVSNYTTPISTSSFTAVTAHSPRKTSSSAGTSSVTAAAGALIRGSRGLLSSLFSSRSIPRSAGSTCCRKSNPPPTLTPESMDCAACDFTTGESFPFPSKQANSFLCEQANFAPSKQADNAYPCASATEQLSYASDGSQDFSMLSEVMDPNFMYPQFPQHEGTINPSSHGTSPTRGKIGYYLSGFTGAIRNFGRPATTWVHPDYIYNQELQYNHVNLDSKMSQQCPQNTLTTSHSLSAATPHQEKRFNVQKTDFGQILGTPENSVGCGDPQLTDFPRAFGSNIPNWISESSNPLPYAAWSNAELSSAQTEDLLTATRQQKYLAEQTRQYQYYNERHQQKRQQHQQQDQTTDDSGMMDDGWDIVKSEACVPLDEQSLCTQAPYLAYENIASEYDKTAVVGTHQLFYSESSANFLVNACLPSQSLLFDNFHSKMGSYNSEWINSKLEETRRIETVPPHITKSKLNPNAKEWTGVCCSMTKLNPEAKEWVPKDERDGRLKVQTNTITETDVENGLVLITINSAGIDGSHANKGLMNESCPLENCEKEYTKEFQTTDTDCNRNDEKCHREIGTTSSSVEQNPICFVSPPPTLTGSLVCESLSEKSNSSGVILCPVPDISANVIEFACDTSLLGLDCVDSIRSIIKTDGSDYKVGKVNCEAAAVAFVLSKVEQERKERKVSDEEMWHRYHSETSESSNCESDEDDESDVVSEVCTRRSDRAKPHFASSSEDEDSSEDESSEEESESEDLVIDLLQTPCGWWRNGCESGDDSTDDEDDESVMDDHDLDTETDDDIVFDCSVDEADCTSVKDKKSKRYLSAMQKVNLRWNSQINKNVTGRSCCKISFNEVVRVDSVDRNVERSGVEWERYAMEAKRFRENVLQPHGAIISQVLGTEHRSRIFKERFAEAVRMDTDGGITFGNASKTLRGDIPGSDKDILIRNICKGAHDVCGQALPDRNCSCETYKNPDSVETVCVK